MKQFFESAETTLCTLIGAAGFIAVVFLFSQCEGTREQQQTQAFETCVRSGNKPSECRLATGNGR